MKKIFKYSLIALFMGMVSCDTDIVQDSEASEETAYQTVDDLQSGLNGVYATYAPDAGGNGSGDSFLWNDLFTDNIKRGTASNNQGSSEYQWNINTNTNEANSIWTNRYVTIDRANRVLRNIDRVTEGVSDADMVRANDIKGQLLAIRALCHFELYQYFTENYQDGSALAVKYLDYVPPLNSIFPRDNVDTLLAGVLSDLDSAGGLIAPSSNSFYITRTAVQAIKARVLLFRNNSADYAQIEQITEDILADNPMITTPEDYDAFWDDSNLTDPNIKEDIFTLFRGQDDNGIAGLFYANSTDEDGSPFFEMSNQLYDLYPSNDIRKFIFVDESSEPNGSPRTLFIDKYPGSSAGQLISHVKIIRASEVQLIKAEAEARQGKFAEASASVHAIRVARALSGNPTQTNYATLQDALRDILLERRKELCFEGHRYLDLKRIGKEINVGISRDSRDSGSFVAPSELAPTDYRFTMPIPRVELDANPGIIQNTNY